MNRARLAVRQPIEAIKMKKPRLAFANGWFEAEAMTVQ
jgi:hypothetical protein